MIRSNPIFDKLIRFSTAETTICVLLLSFGVYLGASKMLTDGFGTAKAVWVLSAARVPRYAA